LAPRSGLAVSGRAYGDRRRLRRAKHQTLNSKRQTPNYEAAFLRRLLHGEGARAHVARITLNKDDLIAQIIAALAGELEGYERSARAAHEYATDEQCKAENKYDTRGLESSYLANGQARQAAEVARAMQQYDALVPRRFAPGEPIQVGAVVEVERKGERMMYFVGPGAGGTEVLGEGREVLVITPNSPVGQQLIGRKQGERVQLGVGGVGDSYRVKSVE
jgi:transcription elongation GreA/GreB family factor